MMKKLMLGAALSALLVSGALAQTPSPNMKANPPAAAKADKLATAPREANTGKPDVVLSQKPDQFLASKFKGTDVLGADNKKIGDVSDILFDKNGTIQAYVIRMGGFLGMGGKDVALAPTAFEVVPGKKGGTDRLKLSMTQQQLKQAQNFTPYSPPHPVATTTGAGGAMGGAPLGGATHPRGSGQ